MLYEVMLRDIRISKTLAATCQPLILFRDVRNDTSEVEGSGEKM